MCFIRLFQATYDDRFEWGLIHSSSGKFRIPRRLGGFLLELAEISEMNTQNTVLSFATKDRLCCVRLDVYSIKETTKPYGGSPV